MSKGDNGAINGGSWLSESRYQKISAEVRAWPQWKLDAYSSIKGPSGWGGANASSAASAQPGK